MDGFSLPNKAKGKRQKEKGKRQKETHPRAWLASEA
jgi:hypothetical protein